MRMRKRLPTNNLVANNIGQFIQKYKSNIAKIQRYRRYMRAEFQLSFKIKWVMRDFPQIAIFYYPISNKEACIQRMSKCPCVDFEMNASILVIRFVGTGSFWWSGRTNASIKMIIIIIIKNKHYNRYSGKLLININEEKNRFYFQFIKTFHSWFFFLCFNLLKS